MIHLTQKLKKNKRGFTLIELIVVIAILAILAAIAIPRLTNFQESAKVSADASTLASVDSAIQIAVANGNINTPSASSTVILTATSGTTTWSGTATQGAGATAIDSAYMNGLLSNPPVFKAANHIDATATVLTWTIDNAGKITLTKTDW